MKKKLILSLVLLISLSFGTSFEDGVKAYEKGDKAKAFQIFEDLASKGDIKAQASLGRMYREGDGVNPIFEKAIYWYEKAANQGEKTAQKFLGDIYLSGKGVNESFEKAFYWYEKAYIQGEIKALFPLENMNTHGLIPNKDKNKAKKLFGDACGKGYKVSCRHYKSLEQEGY